MSVYPREKYGWQTFPLAQVNEVLRHEGFVIQAKKTRSPKQLIACTDAYGGEERFGLFELRRTRMVAG